MALLHEGRRMATLRAVTPCRVAVVPEDRIDRQALEGIAKERIPGPERLGWWRVVVGDAEPERQAVEPLHRSLGDPRQRRDRGRNVHGAPPELAHDQAGCQWAPRC